jgi:hypothetical protein
VGLKLPLGTSALPIFTSLDSIIWKGSCGTLWNLAFSNSDYKHLVEVRSKSYKPLDSII